MPSALWARDYVVSRGKLSDQDLYRMVSCGASVGGRCRKEIVKWPRARRRNLTVGIVDIQNRFPGRKVERIKAALQQAVHEINSAGADIHLRYVENGTPHIKIYLVNAREGRRIGDAGFRGIDGERIEIALVSLWWNRNAIINRAGIAISRDIHPRDIQSIVLEEVTQALGLLTDIKNSYYRRRSIFAEDGNYVTRLQGQDTAVLRQHYPPQR